MKENYSGLLIVDKPKGKTSRDIVNEISFLLKTKRVGHTGTLDPLATGVLLILVGKSTKLVDYLTSKDKEYEVEMKLGLLTDTLDITGTTLKEENVNIPKEKIIEAINSFKGTYEQQVPAYSAVKINGKKLYEYARNNIEIELPKRSVTIYDITNIEINDTIKFKVKVSKGTYIRSLVKDIGEYLGTYGTMVNLRRTSQGEFNIKEAYTIEDIKSGNYKLISNKEIIKNEEEIKLDGLTYKNVNNGVKQNVDSCKEYVYYTYNDELIALYKKEKENLYKMYIKF